VEVSHENDVSDGCPSNYRLATCVRALFHIDVDADAYLPALSSEHEFRCPFIARSDEILLAKIKSVHLVQSYCKLRLCIPSTLIK
jgi:hypothetical protein